MMFIMDIILVLYHVDVIRIDIYHHMISITKTI